MWDINLFSTRRGLSILTFGVLLASLLSIADVHAATTTLRANADGHELDYTPSSGSTDPHHPMVNDTSPDGDITYVYIGSQNQEDYWDIEDSTYQAGTINNVAVYLRVKHDTGGEEFRIKLYTYSSEYDNGADIADSTSYTDYSYTWSTNPNSGLSWTWAEIDALEIGIGSKNIGGFGGEQRVTQAWIVVDYTPSWTWGSYTQADSTCTSETDTFSSGDTVRVCGSNFRANADYDVAVYDGADPGDSRCLSTVAADGSGIINEICSTTDGTEGDWHSQVFIVGGAPATYDGGDPDELVEDTIASGCSVSPCAFTVTVPEFGYMLIPLIMSGMFYLWMRRRFSGHLTGLT